MVRLVWWSRAARPTVEHCPAYPCHRVAGNPPHLVCTVARLCCQHQHLTPPQHKWLSELDTHPHTHTTQPPRRVDKPVRSRCMGCGVFDVGWSARLEPPCSRVDAITLTLQGLVQGGQPRTSHEYTVGWLRVSLSPPLCALFAAPPQQH
jgi:hypothetical protein